jgi:hypothetical protein
MHFYPLRVEPEKRYRWVRAINKPPRLQPPLGTAGGIAGPSKKNGYQSLDMLSEFRTAASLQRRPGKIWLRARIDLQALSRKRPALGIRLVIPRALLIVRGVFMAVVFEFYDCSAEIL